MKHVAHRHACGFTGVTAWMCVEAWHTHVQSLYFFLSCGIFTVIVNVQEQLKVWVLQSRRRPSASAAFFLTVRFVLCSHKKLNFTLQFFRPLNSPPRATERKNIIIPTVVGGRGKQNHKQPRRQNKACWPTDRHGSAQTCIICRQPASF